MGGEPLTPTGTKENQMLTRLERKILDFIDEYIGNNKGESPTLSEIGANCGIKSTGTVHRYISSIENKGFLDKARKGWRTMRIKETK